MTWYLIKLALVLPLLGLLGWAAIWASKRVQGRMAAMQGQRLARIVETSMLSPGLRLAVIEFRGRQILVSVGRGGLTRLAEAPVEGEPA